MSEIQESVGPLSLVCRQPPPPCVLTWSSLCLSVSASPLTIRTYWIWATPHPSFQLSVSKYSPILRCWGLGRGTQVSP